MRADLILSFCAAVISRILGQLLAALVLFLWDYNLQSWEPGVPLHVSSVPLLAGPTPSCVCPLAAQLLVSRASPMLVKPHFLLTKGTGLGGVGGGSFRWEDCRVSVTVPQPKAVFKNRLFPVCWVPLFNFQSPDIPFFFQCEYRFLKFHLCRWHWAGLLNHMISLCLIYKNPSNSLPRGCPILHYYQCCINFCFTEAVATSFVSTCDGLWFFKF